jgi:hypothetical protein
VDRITGTTEDGPDESDDGFASFRLVSREGYANVLGDEDLSDDEGASSSGPSSASRPGSAANTPTGGPTGGKLAHLGLGAHLRQALTVSFGSVAKCAVMGGLAQLAWKAVWYLDAIERYRSSRRGRAGGFSRMNVSDAPAGGRGEGDAGGTAPLRAFARAHNDYGLAHCAAYCKSYKRAALDVADLFETAKIEPVLAQDRVTRTCNSCCVTIAGSLALLMGGLFLITGTGEANDHQVACVLLICFAQSYLLLFTAIEGLRSAVKTIYVCYAENPVMISQAYPIIYHRLSRVVEEHSIS